MESAILKKILLDQKEEMYSLHQRVKLIERDCFSDYLKYIDSKQTKVITGVRRSGKSIIAYQLLKNRPFAYANFDDELLANIAAEDLNKIIEVFYEIYPDFKYIFFDEIQNVAGWELFINRLQRQGFNLVITGSNAKLLSKELATHLTGRHIALELFPFSFKEFLKYHEISADISMLSTKNTAVLKKKFEEYLISGGFPDIVREPFNQRIYIQSLYSNIVDKDVILRHKIRFGNTLKNISNNLMATPSSPISFNKIKNTFNLKSIHTAQNYISFIEETYLIFLLQKFSYKSKERSIANRKLYVIDSGLITVLGFNFSRNLGKIYENIVFLELMRQKSNNEIYYWQDPYFGEVDFIIKEKTKIIEIIQVCYDMQDAETKKRELKSLMHASKMLDCKNLTIITEDTEKTETTNGETINYVPLWKWLLNNSSKK